MAAKANRPNPSRHQVQVWNIEVKDIQLPHIDDDDGLEPKLYYEVRVVRGNETKYSSISFVAGVAGRDANTGKRHAEWYQTHLLSFNAELEGSELHIDVFNDKDSSVNDVHGSLIGSVCFELSELRGRPNDKTCDLRRPGVASNVLPNGYIMFDYCVLSAEGEEGEARKAIPIQEREMKYNYWS